MKRLLASLLFLAFVGQTTGVAAQEKMWRVGLLANGPPPQGLGTAWRDELLRVLARDGFAVDRNLVLLGQNSIM
jgi:hypothetical protein